MFDKILSMSLFAAIYVTLVRRSFIKNFHKDPLLPTSNSMHKKLKDVNRIYVNVSQIHCLHIRNYGKRENLSLVRIYSSLVVYSCNFKLCSKATGRWSVGVFKNIYSGLLPSKQSGRYKKCQQCLSFNNVVCLVVQIRYWRNKWVIRQYFWVS